MRVRSDHDEFWRHAERRYEGFFTDQCDPDAELVEHRVEESTGIEYLDSAWNGVDIRREGDVVYLQRGYARGEWRPRERSCSVVQDAIDFRRTAIFREYGCDSIMRVILSSHILGRGGLIIHSAAILRSGKGYLFVGESGAGKSTLARASKPTSTILTDDGAIVGVTGEQPRVFGTPYYGDFGAGGPNVGVPLAGIYFLHKAEQNRIVPVKRSVAIANLLRQVSLRDERVESQQRVLDLVVELCSKVPAADLHFLPDASFWELIDAG